MSVIGIDFGYQTCYVAAARQGGIETLANECSDRCTPSYVSFGEKSRSMGASAKNQLITNLKNTVWGWKKLTGRNYSDPVVQQEKQLLSYDVVERPDGGTGIRVQYLGEQQIFSPEQIIAVMFTKLKETVETVLKIKLVDCVISVPFFYTDAERRAMMDAASVSGLNVLRLMNDTTATALSYGIYKQDLPAPEEKARHVIFVDVGHSATQVSACAFHKGKLRMIAVEGDANLGGIQYDSRIAHYFADEFLKRYKIDARSNKRAFARLMLESEKVKKLMSANAQDIPLSIECFMNDRDVEGRISRDVMENLCEDLLRRTELLLKKILQSAGLKPEDVYSVEVVGGSSRIPAIKQIVKNVFNLEASTTLNGDEAVARGCALQCAILSPSFRVRDFSITDVQPYRIDLCYNNALDPCGSTMEVFSKFNQIPQSKMLTFYRSEPFELEARYADGQVPYPDPFIGVFHIGNVVPTASGESAPVKVKVRVNIHGVFTISSATMKETVEQGSEEPMELSETNEAAKSDDTKGDVENGEKKEVNEEEKTTVDAEKPATDDSQTNDIDTEKTGDQPANDQSSEKTETAPAATKKNRVRSIDLPIREKVNQMSKAEINQLMEREGQMMAQDKMEKDRADAKNAVEEYVYDMRSRLEDALQEYIKDEDRAKFMQQLNDTENWLYEDGEDEKKQVYTDRLTSLKKVGQPVVDRYREAQERPQAFEELGQTIQLVHKVLEAYDAKDEKYNHIDAAEMDKVRTYLKEKIGWFEKHFNLCSQKQLYENPPVTVVQIRAQKDLLVSQSKPIITKPKPAPKEPPPQEDSKPKEDAQSKESETAATEQQQDTPNSDQQPKDSLNMEVD